MHNYFLHNWSLVQTSIVFLSHQEQRSVLLSKRGLSRILTCFAWILPRWQEALGVCTRALCPVTTARVQPSATPCCAETTAFWWVSWTTPLKTCLNTYLCHVGIFKGGEMCSPIRRGSKARLKWVQQMCCRRVRRSSGPRGIFHCDRLFSERASLVLILVWGRPVVPGGCC